MELKFYKGTIPPEAVAGSNCTFMELKCMSVVMVMPKKRF